MASDDSSGARSGPIVLRIKLRYDDVEAMVQRFAGNVGKSGLFLPTKALQPVGAEIKFELRLSDDTPAVVGLGRVKAATPPDPERPRAAFGMAIELMRVTPQSRALILRMLERRKALGLPEVGLPTAADIDSNRRAELGTGPSPVVPPATGSVVTPVPVAASAPVAVSAPMAVSAPVMPVAVAPVMPVAPLEQVLTAPRRTTGPMAIPTLQAIAPLAPEPSRRKRVGVNELLARASTGGAVAGLEEDVDVGAAMKRARALTNSDLDAELAALTGDVAAPVEVSIDAASAELARQLGGAAVRRARSVPGIEGAAAADVVAAAEPEGAAALEVVAAVAVATPEPEGAAAPDDVVAAAEPDAIAAPEPEVAAAPGVASPEVAAAPIAEAPALAIAEAPALAIAEEPAPDEPAPDEPAPDEPAPDEPAPDEPGPDESVPDGAILAEEPLPVEAPLHLDEAPLHLDEAPLHLDEPHVDEPALDHVPLSLDALDDGEHTEMGGIPQPNDATVDGARAYEERLVEERLVEDRLAEDRLVEERLASLSIAPGYDPADGPPIPVDPVDGELAHHDLSVDEFDDFEILAEADADDADLLASNAEQETSSLRAPSAALPARPSLSDFAERLELDEDSDLYYAAPPAPVAPDFDGGHAYEDALAVSAGNALSRFQTNDEPLEDRAPRRGVQPIFDPEPSSSYTLAVIPTPDNDPDFGPGFPSEPIEPPPRELKIGRPTRQEPTTSPALRRKQSAPQERAPTHLERPTPARAARPAPRPVIGPAPGRYPLPKPSREPELPSLYGSPVDDDELEQALGALGGDAGGDIDDLAIPHATKSGPTRRPVETPAPRVTTDDGIEIDFDDE